MAFVSEAVLTALDACAGPLEAFRFRTERIQDRAEKVAIRFENGTFTCSFQRVRRHDHSQAAYFERDWAEFLTGGIYASGDTSSRRHHEC